MADTRTHGYTLSIMLTSLIGLAGALIGGTLVVAGDFVARRSQRRAERRELLRLAAADLIATYLRARSSLIASKTAGRPVNTEEVWPHERWLALARLFTLPGSEALQQPLDAVQDTTLKLYEARNDPDINQYFQRQLAAIRAFEARVRSLMT